MSTSFEMQVSYIETKISILSKPINPGNSECLER